MVDAGLSVCSTPRRPLLHVLLCGRSSPKSTFIYVGTLSLPLSTKCWDSRRARTQWKDEWKARVHFFSNQLLFLLSRIKAVAEETNLSAMYKVQVCSDEKFAATARSSCAEAGLNKYIGDVVAGAVSTSLCVFLSTTGSPSCRRPAQLCFCLLFTKHCPASSSAWRTSGSACSAVSARAPCTAYKDRGPGPSWSGCAAGREPRRS